MENILTPDEILARTKAVNALRPGADWSMVEDGTITWNDADQTQPTEEEIAAEIANPTPPPPPPPAAETTVMFDHENRIRALEGQPPLTLGDFITKMGP
jgi:hypothetical protein